MTAFDRAARFIGIREIAGPVSHPLIAWWLSLCTGFEVTAADEVPWCSAFVNGIAWDLRCMRSKSAAARSWLGVGTVVELAAARVGWDVVILTRGGGVQPGPDVVAAPGHVGFFAGLEDDAAARAGGRPGGARVHVLGGNQNDAVSVAAYPVARVLGVRRLAHDAGGRG